MHRCFHIGKANPLGGDGVYVHCGLDFTCKVEHVTHVNVFLPTGRHFGGDSQEVGVSQNDDGGMWWGPN